MSKGTYRYQIVISDHACVMSATLEMLLIATIFIIVAKVPLSSSIHDGPVNGELT